MSVAAGEAPQATVLIIDDDPAIVRAVGFRLTRAGYRPLLASGGAEGLAMAQANRPDAIILDLRMPDISGLAVMKHLQESPDTADIPAIILSADAADRARLVALRRGATFFVEKPYRAEALILAVSSALAARRQSDPALQPAGA